MRPEDIAGAQVRPRQPGDEPKQYAEPLLFNLRRLVDEYGYRGTLECLQVCFGPDTKPDDQGR